MYWSSCLSKSSLLTWVDPPRPRPRPRPRPADWPPRWTVLTVDLPPPRWFDCWPLPPRCPRPLPRPRWTGLSLWRTWVSCTRPPRLAPRVRGDFAGERFVVVATGAAFLLGETILPRVLLRVPCPAPRTIVWLGMNLATPRPRTILGVIDWTWIRLPRWVPRPLPLFVVSRLWFWVKDPRKRVLVLTVGVAPRRCLILF